MTIENPLTGLSGPATTTTHSMSKTLVPAQYSPVQRASSSPSRVARIASCAGVIVRRTSAFVIRRHWELMPGTATTVLTVLGYMQTGSSVAWAYGAFAGLAGFGALRAMQHKHTAVSHVAGGVSLALTDIAVATAMGPGAVSVTAWLLTTIAAYGPAIMVKHAQQTSARGIKAALEAQGSPMIEAEPEAEKEDLLAEVQPYVPQTNVDLRRVWLGDDAFGNPFTVNLLRRHTLVAGASDFGKSGLVNLMILRLLEYGNADIYGIDLKPGCAELSWARGVLKKVAGSLEEARAILEWVKNVEAPRRAAIVEAHSQKLLDEGTGVQREWDPDIHGRMIYVVCDELGELFRQDKIRYKNVKGVMKVSEIYESNLSLLRSLGIHFLSATQQPSGNVIGPTDQRGNYSNRLSTRQGESNHAQFVFGANCRSRGFNPETLILPGQFMGLTPEHQLPTRYRCQYVTDRDLAEASKKYRVIDMTKPVPGEPKTLDLPAITDEPWVEMFAPKPAAPTYPDGTEVPQNWVDAWKVFEGLGSATKRELMALCNIARDTSRRFMEDAVQHGVMSRPDGMSERFYLPAGEDAYDVAPGAE